MAEKYRLLKDMPGAKAGTVFEKTTCLTSYSPVGLAIPALDKWAVTNTNWFEPIEDYWKPTKFEEYWQINHKLMPLRQRNDGQPFDEACIAARNCFRTEADAELAADKVRECLMQFHREFSK